MRARLHCVSAFASGLLFAIGLGVAGMTRPEKVIAFLDVGGSWDPTLASVMGAALLVFAVGYRWGLRRGQPLFVPRFELPARTAVDAPLIAGAALFGIGWGLSGFCPGPAIVSGITGSAGVLAFLAAMAGGVLLHGALAAMSHGVTLAELSPERRAAGTK